MTQVHWVGTGAIPSVAFWEYGVNLGLNPEPLSAGSTSELPMLLMQKVF